MFDRLAICDAYYIFASLWHGGQYSKEYAIFGRLNKIGYTPPHSLTEETLSEEAKEVYHRLVANQS